MKEKFKVEFLPEAVEFMETLDQKSQQKIYYNIKKAQLTNNPELLKKLNDNIWEFRTLIKLILGFLLFGINRQDMKLWYLQHMGLLKRLTELQRLTLKKQRE